MEYIKRFKDIALDCYDHCEEKMLVEIVRISALKSYSMMLYMILCVTLCMT